MSLTILEVLQNAEVNLVINPPNPLGQGLGKSQLSNAIKLLEAGYGTHDDFDESWEAHNDSN